MWDVWVVDLLTGESFVGWESVSLRRASRIARHWPDRASCLVLCPSGVGPATLFR